MGLSVAHQLARRGCTVLVISRRRSEAAGFVAAGMLAPHAEGLSGNLLLLGQASLERIPRWVAQIETRELGMAVVELGGGRRRAEDGIDHAVGLSELPQLGQQVSEGDCLALVHACSVEEAELAAAKVQAAVTLSDTVSSGQPVVYEVIEG